MCGIAGIISSSSNIDESIISRMTDIIAHRGPDGEGHFMGDGFTFGHRRLSIVDLSDAGHQPMQYLNRYVITYNGEVYNHLELRELLEAQGYQFKSHTDTEVIMAAYDYWGVDCLNKFNGMWAFVIHDRVKNNFFIARDRFGIKPFYYYQDDCFVFASEIKSILEYSSAKAQPNMDYLQDYLKEGPKEYKKETAFKGVFRFPHSSYLVADAGELTEELKPIVYWTLKPNLIDEKFNTVRAQKLAEEYYELLLDAVRLRLRADVKVGSALSGGLDSSSIVYLVNQQLKSLGKEELQETFSSVYRTEGTQNCDESIYIDLLAKELHVNSNQIEPIEAEVPVEHEKVIWNMENPPESTCMSGWHTFKKVAQTDVIVTLDGQGADEQLAGYLKYIHVYLTSLNIIDFYKEITYFFKIPGAKKHILAAFLMNHFKLLFGKKALEFIVKRVFKKDLELNLNQTLATETMTSLITLIHYSDHASMGHSIESRMPFMDFRLVEFLASVPGCYKMHNGWTKYLARLAFDKKIPDEICWRKDKMGWSIPEDHWFRGRLKSWFIKKIKNSNLLSVLEPAFNIEKEIKTTVSISKLTRRLNISVFEKRFFDHPTR